jgi:hypothetical protein
LIPEIDIWRAAQIMLKRYGDNALEESAGRANELALAGDDDLAPYHGGGDPACEQDPAWPGALVLKI